VTLPSVSGTHDGQFLTVTNSSKYVITITASDNDTIGWPQLTVTSIEILPNCTVILRYNNDDAKWEIVFKAGNQCRPAGTRFYMPFYKGMNYYDGANPYLNYGDMTERHVLWGEAGWTWGVKNKFGAMTIDFQLNDSDYIYEPSNANFISDWDIFASTTGDMTLCGWVYCDDAIGASEYLVNQREDANNRWDLFRNGSGALGLYYEQNSSAEINISGGTLSQTTWHHVALIKIGAETGLYVDGTQVAYDATFTGDTFSAAVEFGRNAAGTNYFDGNMEDWALVHSNIFGAAPNSTPDDSFSLDTSNPLNLVI
jgi:hypothetical protein